jgi:hypothetical protein
LLKNSADPIIKKAKGETRVHAQAQLFFTSPEKGAETIESRRFKFKSPIGPIEYNDIAWYLEDYFRWPFGVFETRANTNRRKPHHHRRSPVPGPIHPCGRPG